MPPSIPDIDLDVSDRDKAISCLKNIICASQLNNDKSNLVKHNTGIYLQNIPKDPFFNISSFPYDVAEEFGYYKIDILPNHVYNNLENIDQLDYILSQKPNWDHFKDPNFVRNLFHFGGMITKDISMAEVVSYYEPKSVDDLAILVSIKMPAKKYLIGLDWIEIENNIWIKEEGMMFKKSHAFSYALVVIVDAYIKGLEYFK